MWAGGGWGARGEGGSRPRLDFDPAGSAVADNGAGLGVDDLLSNVGAVVGDRDELGGQAGEEEAVVGGDAADGDVVLGFAKQSGFEGFDGVFGAKGDLGEVGAGAFEGGNDVAKDSDDAVAHDDDGGREGLIERTRDGDALGHGDAEVGDAFELVVDLDDGQDFADEGIVELGVLVGGVAEEGDGAFFDLDVGGVDRVVHGDDGAGGVGRARGCGGEGFFDEGLHAPTLGDEVGLEAFDTEWKAVGSRRHR